MRDLEIRKLEYLEDYQIKLYLSDGQQVVYDMNDKLKTVRFSDIADFHLFRDGIIIQKKIIKWNGNVEISLAEILMEATEQKKEKWQKFLLKNRMGNRKDENHGRF